MKRIKTPENHNYGAGGQKRRNVIYDVWEKQFINDTSKFIGTTFLKPEDLHREFTDDEGMKWKILGSMEGRDMPCENEKGEIWIWDRWQVSLRMRPQEHENAKKDFNLVVPEKKKAKKERSSSVSKTVDLDFSLSSVEIVSAVYGSGSYVVDVRTKISPETKVSNKLAGDPCPGVQKSLSLKFRRKENSEEFELSFPEKTVLKFLS